MNKICSQLLFVLFLFHILSTPAKSEDLATRTTESLKISDNKVRVAILGFDDLLPASREVEFTRENEGLPQDLADMLIEHVSQKKRYNIVEREVIRRIFNEKKFVSNEEYQKISSLKKLIDFNRDADFTKLVDFGDIRKTVSNHEELAHKREAAHTIPADYLMLAKLTDYNSKLLKQSIPGSDSQLEIMKTYGRLHVRIIDVTQGVIVNSSTIEHEDKAPSSQAPETGVNFLRSLSQKAATYLNNVAFPSRIISLKPLTINRGQVDGLHENDICKVKSSTGTVKDENKIEIGNEYRHLGEITLSNIMDTFSQSQSNIEEVAIGDDVICNTIKAEDSSNSGLPKLAIAAFRINSKNLNIQEGLESFKNTLNSKLTSSFSLNYRILERENFGDVFSENEINILFLDSSPSKVKLPKVQDADYLLFISINDLTKSTHTKRIELLDEDVTTQILKTSGAFRLVNTAAQTVSKSGTFEIEKKLGRDAENRSHSEILSALIANKIREDIFGTNESSTNINESKEKKPRQEVPW